jgi:hypothetical protein
MAEMTYVETGLAATDWKQLGEAMVMCLRTRDFEQLAEHFRPQVTCRLLVPSGLSMPLSVSALMGTFHRWFGEADDFTMEDSQIDQVGDCLCVGYRIRLCKGGIWYVVGQQTYSQLDDGTITRFDLLCSGFRLDHARS